MQSAGLEHLGIDDAQSSGGARSTSQLRTYRGGSLSAHRGFVPWWFPAVVQFRRDKAGVVEPIT